MEKLLEIVLQISLSTAAVIGVLLLLVPLWQKRYSAKWRKAIWLLLAVRLLIPFSPELSVTPVQMDMNWQAVPVWQSAAMDNAIPDAADVAVTGDTVQTVSNAAQGNVAAVTDTAEATGLQVSRGEVWALIWLIGGMIFLLIHGIQYVIFHRKVLKNTLSLPEQDNLLRQAGEGLKLRSYPDVMVSSEAQGPMLIGFMKPMIVLPERIYSQQELLLILRHELVHHQQHDLWYKLVLLAANAVHWFNPLVYLLIGQANRDVEQVCDEKVVANQDMAYRKAYSMTILQAMSNSRGIALSTYLSKEAQNGKKRFAAILYPQQHKKGLLLLCIVLVVAIGISGCLQVGTDAVVEIDEEALKGMGAELYKQVAPWLPERAIQNTGDYTFQIGNNDSQRYYTWKELPVEVSEIEGGTWPAAYVQTDDKLYRYQHMLEVWIDADTQEITGFTYYQDGWVYYDEELLAASSFFQTEESKQHYVEQFAENFIPDGSRLVFQRDLNISGNYTAMDEKNHMEYLINLDPVTGRIHSYQKRFFHLAWQNELENWAVDQYRKNMGDVIEFPLDIEAKEYNFQWKKDGQYILAYPSDRFYWRPKLTTQMEQKLERLRQIDAQQYEVVYRSYQGTFLKRFSSYIVADIAGKNKLDLSTAQLYYYDETNSAWKPWDGERWQWEKNRMQIEWTAASYARAYCEKQREAMSLFGVVDGIVFSEQTYRYVYNSVLMDHCKIATTNLDGSELVALQVELTAEDDSVDYLTMELEKVNDEWQVTDARLEK